MKLIPLSTGKMAQTSKSGRMCFSDVRFPTKMDKDEKNLKHTKIERCNQKKRAALLLLKSICKIVILVNPITYMLVTWCGAVGFAFRPKPDSLINLHIR
jgi:hypothetical protein